MKPTAGRILRTDYRAFQFSITVPFMLKHQMQDAEQVGERVNRYMKNRNPDSFSIQLIDRTVLLEWKSIDDARMFVLAFSDVIDTHGVRFE